MAHASNETNYRRLIEEGFNQGNLAVVDEMVAPNAIEHQRGAVSGRDGVVRTITYLRSAFPDFSLTIDELVVAGDKVWARQHGGGTNLGSFMGKPPTGKKASIDVFDVCRFEDGFMVEHWGVPDQLGLLLALELIPTPSRPTPLAV